ncbi:MAG TPA: M48 family metalloprotease [Candidatus Eremiobacteraceae bacterium]|jgi:predicted Zn-dependent protease
MTTVSRRSLRFGALALALWLPLAQSPALALSTSKEIAEGKSENAQIDSESVVIKDPFLTSWVASVTDRLVPLRIRKDIPYQFTIIQDESINAFAIKGGFVHVNMGLLNFVTSDDQLAATLGHEMGHVELHHVTKSDNTNAILAILEGILSIVSGPAAILGSIGGELATDKFSRVDELQADHYGLGIMTKAGFDPHAAVDVMYGLGAQDPGPTGRADKAFLDHPVPGDRVAHLLGYQELDRVSSSALLARAVHDQLEGRYSYAREMLAKVAATDPSATVDDHKQQLNYALREAGALAAPDSRDYAPAIPATDPKRIAAAAALTAAQHTTDTTLADVKKQAQAGLQDLTTVEQQLQQVSNAAGGGGSGSGGPPPVLVTLNRDLSAVGNLTSDVLGSAPGLVAGNKDALHDLSTPLQDPQPLTPMNASLLGFYPSMTANLSASSVALADSVAVSRAALAQLESTLIGMQSGANGNGDYGPNGLPASTPDPKAGPRVPAILLQLAAAAASAHVTASRASDEMYAAQTAQLSEQITMLDLYSSPERFEAYRAAVSYRLPGIVLPAYGAAIASGVAPGDLGCASWYAFETRTSISTAMDALRASSSSCARLALDHHLLAESMEIAEGLLYENYVETPLTKPAGT